MPQQQLKKKRKTQNNSSKMVKLENGYTEILVSFERESAMITIIKQLNAGSSVVSNCLVRFKTFQNQETHKNVKQFIEHQCPQKHRRKNDKHELVKLNVIFSKEAFWPTMTIEYLPPINGDGLDPQHNKGSSCTSVSFFLLYTRKMKTKMTSPSQYCFSRRVTNFSVRRKNTFVVKNVR